MSPRSVVIVGGGVCGLGIGWKLSEAGLRVTLFERDEAAHGSTWASAGMLAPSVELRPQEDEITLLGVQSLFRWRRFAGELEAASGMSVDYRDEGTMFVALDRDATEQLQFLHKHQQDLGLPVEWLSGYEARQRELHLSRKVAAAVYAPDDHQVDPRALATALVAAFINAGGQLHTHTAVDSIIMENGRATGIRVGGEEITADAVLIAAGAWSGMIGGLPESSRLPVRPVKGQMLAVQQPKHHLLQHSIWAMDSTRFVYMAPKSNGRLLIGATVEEVGFDMQVTAGGLLELLRIAWDTVPGLYDLPVLETWAGLRPASRDNAPILGRTDVEGLYVATGHYRNGILFAPVTAEDMAHVVLTGETTETIAPFAMDRFAVHSA